MMEDRKPHRKTRVGTVVSNKMDKTIVVRVSRYAEHPLYGKRIIRSTKYMAHDEENTCRIGDKVSIGEVRPMSKNKCWSLLEVIERAPVFDSESSSRGEE
jgi:small subunit ribosomal protein S17